MDDFKTHLARKGLLPDPSDQDEESGEGPFEPEATPQAAAHSSAQTEPWSYDQPQPEPGWSSPTGFTSTPFDPALPHWGGAPATVRAVEIIPAAPRPEPAPAPWPSRFQQQEAERGRQLRSEAWGRQSVVRALEVAREEIRREHLEDGPSPLLRVACAAGLALGANAVVGAIQNLASEQLNDDQLASLLRMATLVAAGYFGADELARMVHRMLPPTDEPLDRVPWTPPPELLWEAQRHQLDPVAVERGWCDQRNRLGGGAGDRRRGQMDVRLGPVSLKVPG
jgi:hypothetical protein